MPSFMIAVVLSVAAASGIAAQQADSAAFVIRLGRDTTAIERYVRTVNRLEAESVSRSPNTMLHRWVIDFSDDLPQLKRAEYTVSRVGERQPVSTRIITFVRDSAVIEMIDGANRRTQTVAAGRVFPMAGPFYFPYEWAMMSAIARNQPTTKLLAGTNLVDINVKRVGRDSVTLNNQFDEPMRAHVDAQGRLLHLSTPAYTTVERLKWVDLDRLARDFAARDAAGKGMGSLSPRSTVRKRIAGANIWIDYSRPAARGRPIWGALVPWGSVWRMGANDAAHLATDRTLELGNLTLSPGTYTLFLLPNRDKWELIINRATGMSGLDYDAAQDVERLQLTVEPVSPAVESFLLDAVEVGGAPRLMLAWGGMRAWVPFRVR